MFVVGELNVACVLHITNIEWYNDRIGILSTVVVVLNHYIALLICCVAQIERQKHIYIVSAGIIRIVCARLYFLYRNQSFEILFLEHSNNNQNCIYDFGMCVCVCALSDQRRYLSHIDTILTGRIDKSNNQFIQSQFWTGREKERGGKAEKTMRMNSQIGFFFNWNGSQQLLYYLEWTKHQRLREAKAFHTWVRWFDTSIKSFIRESRRSMMVIFN